MSTFALNCLLLNDAPTKVFTVKIPKSENVSVLKEMIKAKNPRHLAQVDVKDLNLWKVRLPPGQPQILSLTRICSWRRQYTCSIVLVLRSPKKSEWYRPICRTKRMKEMITFSHLTQLGTFPITGRIVLDQSIYTF